MVDERQMTKLNETIKNLENLTLGDLGRILIRVKIRVLFSIAAAFLAWSFVLLQVGQHFQLQETAVTLGRPFDMSFKKSLIEETVVDAHGDESKIRFEKLFLVEDPEYPRTDSDVGFKLRKIFDSTDVRTIGVVVAQKGKIKEFFIGASITNKAHAQQDFNWYGHENNYRFREKLVARNTIRRYYDDGWILEYKIDEKGRSIPSSFRWIKKD